MKQFTFTLQTEPTTVRFADGDRWRRALGLGPCRLIIDQEDRDGSRGGEDTEERRGGRGGGEPPGSVRVVSQEEASPRAAGRGRAEWLQDGVAQFASGDFTA
ncbi:unnamed protein product [Pleuronectes platessa]|uniref:Uncharacterized protein n=1 Tax=Pleuronectes platessa TaxID=8262 RepID=A0A9N7VUS6_PLEPL|nr:unnamed protein product [Pleuronectes platessa]